MTNNVFDSNIIYHGGTWPGGDLWLFEADGVTPMAMPNVNTNLYYAVGGTLPNTGAVTDSRPIVADPKLRDPANGDYSFTDGGKAVSVIHFPAMPT